MAKEQGEAASLAKSEFCHEAGMNDYIAKPIDKDRLTEILAKSI